MKEKLYNKMANYYDLFNFSDYIKQSKFISLLIKKNFRRKAAVSIKVLDLACGTGEHIKILKKEYQIEGADINEGMIRVARKKNPSIKIARGDLCNLQLKKDSYDVIFCLSSSMQYILTSKILDKTLETIYLALKSNGIFIFDLAYCRENWQEGYVGIKTVIQKNLQIAEIFKSKSEDNISFYNPIYLINNNGKVDFFIDKHEIYLYAIRDVEKIVDAKFSRVKIYTDYSEKFYNFSKNHIPIFLLKK